jgi:hypothetical protein
MKASTANSGLDELVLASADESNFILVTENLQLLPNFCLNVLVFGVKSLKFLLVGGVDLLQSEVGLF